MIPVTKTFLPPIEEYTVYVQRAYNNGWLTNRGELVCELDEKLTEYLGLTDSKILSMNNGTIPLQIALKILGKGGEIITTPFSYVATASAIVWEGCTPVFVDIHPEYLTIDESKIEDAITEKTTCILATHVFGNPCNIEEIDRIANKHNIKVIYDAAHCFGVKYKGKSIFEYGDISTCSFHSTKVFHTGEGGAIFTKNLDLFEKSRLSHSFGHKAELYSLVGINGKMSELSASMGLSVLKYIDDIIDDRQRTINYYLSNIDFKLFSTFKIRNFTIWNFSYFPLIFKDENEMHFYKEILEKNNIYGRRYFYPSLNTLSSIFLVEYYPMFISEDISSRILCLPVFYQMTNAEIVSIVSILNYSK